MIIEDLLSRREMTKYRLAVESGVPHATLNDICSGKTKLEKCSAETVYKLAKALGVSMAFARQNGNKPLNTACPTISSMIWTPIKTG